MHTHKKKWGQNFLRNAGAVRKIVEAVEPTADEIVLEIGPGEGALTLELAKLGRPVIAYEIDPELVPRLRQKFEGTNVEIRETDATEEALPAQPFRAVGNLPYNVGTPILRRVISTPECRRAVFMVQKEVANRILAGPGDEDYGFLSLYCEIFASRRLLMTLEPGSFYPPPKVRSAVVVLDPHPPTVTSPVEKAILLISSSFRMRRKKLVNNLTGSFGSREQVLGALSEAGLSPDVRAEQMSLGEFDRLAGLLS